MGAPDLVHGTVRHASLAREIPGGPMRDPGRGRSERQGDNLIAKFLRGLREFHRGSRFRHGGHLPFYLGFLARQPLLGRRPRILRFYFSH